MSRQEPKASLLATSFDDGRASAMEFVADHQLALAWTVQEGAPRPLLVDLELGAVMPGRALPKPKRGELLLSHANDKRVASAGPDGLVIDGKKVPRAGKTTAVRWADDGGSVFSASRWSEVLNRWSVPGFKAQKFKCWDRATHVACTPALLAVQNKEGVVIFFDARKPKRLVAVRPTPTGWLAFDDGGAWDASEGFTRGAELSWSDAKSIAFVPGTGFGWLELNQFPLTRVVKATGGKTPGLLALRTAGRW